MIEQHDDDKCILDSQYETLTIKNKDGLLSIRNIDEYNILRYQDFNGERIIIDLDENCSITETFEEGIFNIKYKDTSMQLRNKIEIAKRIKYCIENKTSDPIRELLFNEIKDELKEDILIRWLYPFGSRLSINKDCIIIDDLFKVDMNGQAYYKSNNTFNRLCIVAGKTGQINKVLTHELGDIQIDFKTMEIYTKVLFLLFPNIKDSVFFNQLPENLKIYIRKMLSEIE